MSRIPPLPARDTRRTVLLGVGALLIVLGIGALIAAVTSLPSTPVAVTGGASPSATLASPSSSGSAPPASASPTADAGATSSSESSPVVTAAPLPDTGDAPAITTFSVSPATAECRDDRAGTVPLTFAWQSEGAVRAWIGVGTTDASAQPFAEVATTQSAYGDLSFACNTDRKVFTLTVEGDGGRTSRSIVVTRVLP